MAEDLYVKEILQPRGGGEPLSSSVVPLPPTVEFDTLLHFFETCYGPALDEAWTDGPDLEPLNIGWVFAAPDEPQLELMMIPLVADPEQPGTYLSLFLQMARQRKMFGELQAKGLFDKVTVVNFPQRAPDEPPDPEVTSTRADL